ncbi:winged helix-turn-helix transcriptional regulator [Micromonospora matsumotoense]|uniref:winged helix-turn-helix transcriptional regulator n=1 Tax=Micromonospora matsumotoense TaxID=121616 RepID=UPI003D8C19F9
MPVPTSRFDPVCPSGIVPIHIGDKWTAMVITLLAAGPMRHSDIRAQVGPVTAKVLTAALRGLERNGFVDRMEQPGPPRTVHYGLTPLGRTLLPAIALAVEWAQHHLTEMLDAQEAYDRAHSGGGRAEHPAPPRSAAAG